MLRSCFFSPFIGACNISFIEFYLITLGYFMFYQGLLKETGHATSIQWKIKWRPTWQILNISKVTWKIKLFSSPKSWFGYWASILIKICTIYFCTKTKCKSHNINQYSLHFLTTNCGSIIFSLLINIFFLIVLFIHHPTLKWVAFKLQLLNSSLNLSLDRKLMNEVEFLTITRPQFAR